LSALFPGELLVIPTGHEKVRANDTFYRFRPGSDFYYLTGNVEPDCVLVLEPTGPTGHRDVLFVEPNPVGKTTPSSPIATRASFGWGRASAFPRARRASPSTRPRGCRSLLPISPSGRAGPRASSAATPQ